MRPAILTAFLLLACAFTGCKLAAPAPAFPVTEVVAPAPDSPDDREQFADVPAAPVSVPAKTPDAPAGYECRDGVCGPARGERVIERAPVRSVLGRLPVVRRFGR